MQRPELMETKPEWWLCWDTTEAARNRAEDMLHNLRADCEDAKYRLEMQKSEMDTEEFEEWLKEATDSEIKDAFFMDCIQDSDQGQWDWDDLCSALTEEMEKRNPSGRWHCEVTGFGWRQRDGYKDFEAEDGEDLLREVLPRTDNTFYIYPDGENGLKIENAHHDAPTGGEWYHLTPQKDEEEEEEVY